MGRGSLKVLLAALAAPLAAAAGVSPAAPAGWHAVAGDSEVTFEAMQAGGRFTGRFERFATEVEFDPRVPAGCRLDVSIETGSAVTGESQRDGILRGPDFFAVETYPSAVFRGGHCRPAGRDFEAPGSLTLRGVTRPVVVRFRFARQGEAARMSGFATVRRLDFGVGQGEWSDTRWVGDEVTVRFDLSLAPERAAATLTPRP